MSKLNHTPAPWRYIPQDNLIEAVGSCGRLVDICIPRSLAVSIEERTANGFLIAAAPALYHALGKLLVAHPMLASDAAIEAQELLAKLEGGDR